MLRIPVPTKAGRDFLDGDGHFELASDGDAWNAIVAGGRAFDQKTDKIADATFSVDTNRDFTFGREHHVAVALRAKAKAVHQVQVLWPGDDDDRKAALEYGLTIPDGHLYARVKMETEAELGADAKFPAGPLSATVGVTAGGNVGYERWILRQEDTPARDVLTHLYGGIRLPQQIDRQPEVPELGELLVTRLGGYLHLNAGISWGYSVEGSREGAANRLDLALEYRLRAMASLSVGYQIAGDYQIEARRGSTPDWVRFVVRKSRTSKTTIAADFGLDVDLELKGLPESADEFLSKLLGADADRALELFAKARKYTSVDELEKAAGNLVMPVIRRYSKEVLDIPLNNTTVQAFLKAMQQVTEGYANLDKRVTDLYHQLLREAKTQTELDAATAKTVAAIDVVLGSASREAFVSLIGTRGGDSVELLRRLYNDEIFDVLGRNGSFAKAVEVLTTAKGFLTGKADGQIKRWIDLMKAELPVNTLLTQLSRFDTEAKIRALADEKLKALVEQLIGKAFDKLEQSDIGELLALLHNDLERINSFKTKWYENLREQARQSFSAQLHLAYSRARKNERLLDVEINLASAKGPDIAREAATGNFFPALNHYDPSVARINKGFFRTELRNAAAVQVKLLGWGFDGAVTLLQNADHSFEPQGGGLLHLYSSRTSIERKSKSGWRAKEETQSRFLVAAVGQTFQAPGAEFREHAVDALTSLGSEYALLQKDDRTSVDELAEYLRLAHTLGLMDRDPASFASELAAACGGELGKVTVDYLVRFNADSLKAVFNLVGASDVDGGELGREARRAMREFLLRKAAAMAKTDWYPRVVFAYSTDQAYQWHRSASLSSNLRAVVVPGWLVGSKNRVELGLTGTMVLLVERLFTFEDSLAKSLVALDRQVEDAKAGKALDFVQVNAAIADVLKAAASVDEYDASCFAAVLDALAQKGSGGRAMRDSAVIVEATPSAGPLAGKKVTRYLAAGPKNPAELAVDAPAEPAALATAG